MRVRCETCGSTLGEWIADLFVMRHRGREIACRGEIVSLRCESCGAVMTPRPEAPTGPAAGAAGAGTAPVPLPRRVAVG